MASLQSQKIFKAQRGSDAWVMLIKHLQGLGYGVYDTPEKSDVSIVIDGRFENPNCFDGKRVLVWHDEVWKGEHKFNKKLLKKYYDLIIDVTNINSLDGVITELNKYDICCRHTKNRNEHFS